MKGNMNNSFKMFESKDLTEKLNKIKKQLLYKEELQKIKDREKRYLERKNKGGVI